MIALLSIPRSIVHHFLLSIALLVSAAITLSGLVAPARADTGKWTPRENWAETSQARFAVNMMLLRGDSQPVSVLDARSWTVSRPARRPRGTH